MVAALVRPHPLSARDEVVHPFPEGQSLAQMARLFWPDPLVQRHVVIFVGDWIVPRGYWQHVRPKHGAFVRLGLTAFEGGGSGNSKNILALVATIALAVFAPYAAGTLMGLTGMTATVVAAGITMVGSMVIAALFKPPSIDVGAPAASPADAPTYTITGQANQATPYGAMLRVYGRHRIFPRLAAVPFTQTEGPHQYLFMLLDCGYGPLQIDDLKIGDTPLLNYRDVLYRIHQRWKAGDDLVYYRNDVSYETFSLKLVTGQAEIRGTAPDASGIVLDFVLPRGLVIFDDRGARYAHSVGFDVYLRRVGDEYWQHIREFPVYISKGGSVNPTNPDAETPLPDPVAPAEILPANIGAFVTAGLDRRIEMSDQHVPAGATQVRLNVGDESVVQVGDSLYLASLYMTTITNLEPNIINDEGRIEAGWVIATFTPPTPELLWGGFQSPVTRPPPPPPVPETPPEEIVGQPENPDPTSEIIITDAQPMAINFSLTIDVPAGPYEVQVIRRSAETTSDRQFDELVWGSIRSLADRPPIAVQAPHTLIELKIRASEQLSGVLQDVNCVATSILPVWDGAAWVEQATRNPAWAFADVLRGSGAIRPMPDWRIDFAGSLKHWADYCDLVVANGMGGAPEARVRFDHVVDYATTTYQLLQSIAAAGRATPAVRDGKHGVIVDEEQVTPVQMFTPRNSWGFNARRNYMTEPDGLRVKFVDPENNWMEGNVVIYKAGHTANTAVTFEDLKLFGVTRYTQATRDGRYMKAQALLRREEFSINCDIENVICTRGDRVVVQHDVLRVGGDSSRIVEITGDAIRIADPFGELPAGQYGVRIRLADGSIAPTKLATPFASAWFQLNIGAAAGVAVGDLVSWGFFQTETGEDLVKQIAPADDLSALLTLAEIARDVYRADEGSIPAYLPPSGGRPVAGAGPAVVGLRADQVNSTVGREPYADIVLTWYPAQYGGYPKYKIAEIHTNGITTQIGETNLTQFTAARALRMIEFTSTLDHTFVVVGIDAIGRQSKPAYINFSARDPLLVPDPPQYLSSNAHDKTTTLTWFAPTHPANMGNAQVVYFEVRYQPTGVPSWGAGMRVTELVPWNVTTVTVPSRNGTYMVKAITASKIESAAFAATVISTEDLVIQDIWSTHNFAPAWAGTFDKCHIDDTGALVLTPQPDGTYPARGVYYAAAHELFSELVQCRISSFIAAAGQNNAEVMALWIPLAMAQPLSSVPRTAWGASIWISASASEFFTMDEWMPLALAAPLAGDFPLLPASNWRPLLHGEYIAQDLRFAVVLDSLEPNVTPRVTLAQVDIDFPERREEHADIVIPAAGLNFIFARPFVFPPSVAIDLQDAAFGDYVDRAAADKIGFPIAIRDGVGALKGGVVDISAFGAGRTF